MKSLEQKSTKAVILIPALNPDKNLIDLAKRLKSAGSEVIVVNDGSGKNFLDVFRILASELHCIVISHSANLGKGAALKTGLRHIAETFPDAWGVVTADADGQHGAQDILRVSEALETPGEQLFLGSRDFSGKDIPFKSKWGNRITSLVYFLSTGKKCADTQTGLRGIPKELYEICGAVPGDRYEYEMNLLLEMGRRNIPLVQVPISTIYMENNQASHFHPVLDSARIYFNIMKYSVSSLLSAATDLGLFTVFVHQLFGGGINGIFFATILARAISGTVNFMMNKHFVFESDGRHGTEAWKYFTLFVCQMTSSWLLVYALSILPLHLTLVKILVDGSLFFISYQIQKKYIFKMKGEPSKDEKLLLKTE